MKNATRHNKCYKKPEAQWYKYTLFVSILIKGYGIVSKKIKEWSVILMYEVLISNGEYTCFYTASLLNHLSAYILCNNNICYHLL